MAIEYHWWDLEDSTFKGELLETIGCFYLYDLPYESWAEFEAAMPHMAYTHLVLNRFDPLEQQFVDLRLVPQMLAIDTFPIRSSAKPINRYEWLKSVNDLKLMRFSSIRDLSLHFVNQVFLLDVPDHRVRLETILSKLPNNRTDIQDTLKSIAEFGKQYRDERNLRIHEGHHYQLTDDDQIFRAMATGEEYGSELVNYEIESKYVEAANSIYTQLVPETKRLLDLIITLVDDSLDEFDRNYWAKRPEGFEVPKQ